MDICIDGGMCWNAPFLMEMKIIKLQRAEFKNTPKIKVKNCHGRLIHLAEIL